MLLTLIAPPKAAVEPVSDALDGLEPQVPGYLGSLTRRMKQQAELLQGRRVECLN